MRLRPVTSASRSLIDEAEAAWCFEFLEQMNQLDELEVPPP